MLLFACDMQVSLPPNWNYIAIPEYYPAIALRLPQDVEFPLWPHAVLVQFTYPHNADDQIGFVVDNLLPDGQLPQGKIFDGVCKKLSTFEAVDAWKNDSGIIVEKIKTTCGNLVRYHLSIDSKDLWIFPDDHLTVSQLKVIEQIVRTARPLPPSEAIRSIRPMQ